MKRVDARVLVSFLFQHSLAGLVVLLLGIIFTWYVTYGTWNLFATEWLGGFYDAQARSLVRGRLDVSPAAICPEAFIVDGKYYGYFGIGPALLRLPTLAFKGMNGRWSRFSVVLASVLLVGLAYLCLRLMRNLFGEEPPKRAGMIDVLFLVLVGLGSTTVFLTSRAFVYHEALAWGSVFGLGYFYAMLRYIEKPSLSLLAGCVLLSTLCISTRVPAGFGTVVGTMFLAACLGLGLFSLPPGRRWTRALTRLQLIVPERARTHATVACLGVVIAFGSYVAINQIKFGTWLDGSPMNYYERWHYHTNDCWDGKPFRLDVVPANLWAYLTEWGLDWNRLPWIHLKLSSVPREHCYREPYTSVASCMPALCLLSLIGLVSAILAFATATKNGARLVVVPIMGALACWAPVLMSYTLTQRYLHDILPFLILTAAIGLVAAMQWARTLRWTFGMGVLSLGLVSVLVNTSCALHYQRDQDGVAAKYHVAFHRWKHEIDKSVFGRTLPPGEIAIGADEGRVLVCVPDASALPGQPTLGEKVVLLQEKQMRVFDGSSWMTVPWDASLWETLEVRCDIAFPAHPQASIEPLCISGRCEMTDLVFVKYLEDGRVAFGIERRGVFHQVGEPQAISANEQGRLCMAFDCMHDRLTVTWNDREALAVACPANRPRKPEEIMIGSNEIGHTASDHFSGRLAGVSETSAIVCESPNR